MTAKAEAQLAGERAQVEGAFRAPQREEHEAVARESGKRRVVSPRTRAVAIGIKSGRRRSRTPISLGILSLSTRRALSWSSDCRNMSSSFRDCSNTRLSISCSSSSSG